MICTKYEEMKKENPMDDEEAPETCQVHNEICILSTIDATLVYNLQVWNYKQILTS